MYSPNCDNNLSNIIDIMAEAQKNVFEKCPLVIRIINITSAYGISDEDLSS